MYRVLFFTRVNLIVMKLFRFYNELELYNLLLKLTGFFIQFKLYDNFMIL